MWSTKDCILGQVFPVINNDPYECALGTLGLEAPDALDLGFADFDVPASRGGFRCEILRNAWVEHLEAAEAVGQLPSSSPICGRVITSQFQVVGYESSFSTVDC